MEIIRSKTFDISEGEKLKRWKRKAEEEISST